MSEDWAAIAADVGSAIADVGFYVTLTRRADGPATPWDTADVINVSVVTKAVELKPWRRMRAGSSEYQTGRTLLIGADAQPAMGDKVTLHGSEHEVLMVTPLTPGGVDLMFRVELAT